MSHDHDHSHGGSGNMLLFAVLLTLGYAAVEAGVGLWAGSLALVADTGHMVNDAAALALAAGASWLTKRSPTLRHSYGLGRAEFLAALINSLGLLAGNFEPLHHADPAWRKQFPDPGQDRYILLTG